MRHWLFGDRPELTEDERRLVLRAMAVIAVPLATITALILIAGGGFAIHELRDKTIRNKNAIEAAETAAAEARETAFELNKERANRENALAWQVYDECLENESQDASFTGLVEDTKLFINKQPTTTPGRAEFLEALDEAIDAREPEDEADCAIPIRPRPGNEP